MAEPLSDPGEESGESFEAQQERMAVGYMKFAGRETVAYMDTIGKKLEWDSELAQKSEFICLITGNLNIFVVNTRHGMVFKRPKWDKWDSEYYYTKKGMDPKYINPDQLPDVVIGRNSNELATGETVMGVVFDYCFDETFTPETKDTPNEGQSITGVPMFSANENLFDADIPMFFAYAQHILDSEG